MGISSRQRGDKLAGYHRQAPGGASRSERVAVAASVGIVALVALALAGTYFYRQTVEARSHSIYVAAAAEADCRAIVDRYIKAYPEPRLSYANRSNAGLILDAVKEEGRESVAVRPVPALTIKSGPRVVTLRPERTYWLSFDSGDRTVGRLAGYLDSCHTAPEQVSLTAVGDIIPGRTVAKMMANKGVAYPFSKIAPALQGADIVYGDLEAPLSDRVKPPYKGLAFIAPSSTVQGLKLLGLDIVSLANNHSTNFGLDAFTDTLTVLKNNGIKYAGGGMNLAEARSPAVLDVRGQSFAFLDYNSISGSLDADATKPGVAWIRMRPFSKDSPDDMALVRQAVADAEARGCFVVACFHWSEEYKHRPSDSQRNMAHLAVDAGADLVIGSHPHCIQSIEMYNGKLIAYSLGNFIFDQMEHEYTREGVIMKCRYRGNVLTGLEFVPYLIEDWCQPNVASGPAAQKILDKLISISGLQ